jgi:hypothetical protein
MAFLHFLFRRLCPDELPLKHGVCRSSRRGIGLMHKRSRAADLEFFLQTMPTVLHTTAYFSKKRNCRASKQRCVDVPHF